MVDLFEQVADGAVQDRIRFELASACLEQLRVGRDAALLATERPRVHLFEQVTLRVISGPDKELWIDRFDERVYALVDVVDVQATEGFP